MNKVYGRVIVKETNHGIPDLVVALFDIDIEDGVNVPTTPINIVPPNTPEGYGVDRLGSVLTDQNGNFEILFEDEAFKLSDRESRPDLQLIVFAPEDVTDENTRVPLGPDERVLIHSNVSRQDAAKMEAYILRLPLILLEKYNIPIPGEESELTIRQQANKIIQAQKRSIQLEDMIRKGLQPIREKKFLHLKEIDRKAHEFVMPLQSVSMEVRSMPTFLPAKSDTEAFDTAKRAGMSAGIDKMNTSARPTNVIHAFSDRDLHHAGIELPPEYTEGVIEEIEFDKVCRLLHHKRNGVAIERVRDLVEETRETLAKKGKLDAITSGSEETSDTPDSGGETAPPLPATGTEAVETGVLNQLKDLTSLHVSTASSVDELSARLTGLKLPKGPADTVALHDFHQLQIAFEHVWTEGFDERLRDEIEELYRRTVKLHEEYGVTMDMPTEIREREEIYHLLTQVKNAIDDTSLEISREIQKHFSRYINQQKWVALSPEQRDKLEELALEITHLRATTIIPTGDSEEERDRELGMAEIRRDRRIMDIYREAIRIIDNPLGQAARLFRLLNEISIKLGEPYAFHYFAPNSVNFGILLTYRQKWEPLDYQVGNLVSIIPLAPGEVRKYSSKTVVKQTRSQKEVEKAMSSRRGESSITQRAESEILAKASMATNFKLTSEGSFSFGIGSIGGSSEFSHNQAEESSQTKKDFREAVMKATEEYKKERTIEIQTSDELSTEISTSGEIKNINDEKPVTFLFYELERQFRISERIHRVAPVIMVAQDVPGPHEITESWLLEHGWILRRVLLDDELEIALDQISNSFAGDELSVKVKKANWESQKRITEELEATVSGLLSVRDNLRFRLVRTEESHALAAAREEAEGLISDLGDELFSGDMEELERDQLEERVKSIEKQLHYVDKSLGESQGKLATAKESLNIATQEYTDNLEAQTNRRVAIDQLRMHVKQNILYYMQAIWDHEPLDQRFFRLYHIDVDLPESATRTCLLRLATESDIESSIPTIECSGRRYVIESCSYPVPPSPGLRNTKKLVEIADLDRPLGYKGNYILFPIKTCVYLTEYMMREFIDDYFGIRDPDELANITTDDLMKYIELIWNNEEVTLTPEQQEALKTLVLERMREPRRDSDIVVVPTGQLYIEALLGSHTLLEEFKNIHRAYDVAKVRAEVREAELENLRRAARLIGAEPDLSDPDVDKKIVVDGSNVMLHEPV